MQGSERGGGTPGPVSRENQRNSEQGGRGLVRGQKLVHWTQNDGNRETEKPVKWDL